MNRFRQTERSELPTVAIGEVAAQVDWVNDRGDRGRLTCKRARLAAIHEGLRGVGTQDVCRLRQISLFDQFSSFTIPRQILAISYFGRQSPVLVPRGPVRARRVGSRLRCSSCFTLEQSFASFRRSQLESADFRFWPTAVGHCPCDFDAAPCGRQTDAVAGEHGRRLIDEAQQFPV